MQAAASAVQAGTQQMAAQIEDLRNRTVAAFGSIAKAPRAVRDSLNLLGSEAMKLSSNMSIAAEEIALTDAALKKVEGDTAATATETGCRRQGHVHIWNRSTGRWREGGHIQSIMPAWVPCSPARKSGCHFPGH
jgi:hypothetical protein